MITIECNYSKKLGLPQYSSHQFSITLRTELTDLGAVQAESARLYQLLQQSVDASIQQIGFLPQSNGHGPESAANGNGNQPREWNCSPRQWALIHRLAEEKSLADHQLEALAQEKCAKSLRSLNKVEASGLIDELFSLPGGITYGNGR